jgi:hypothetical protein
MKKLSTMAALCVFATLVLASCSKTDSGTTNPPADKNYFPLTAGNSWTYDGVATEDKSGTVTDIAGTSYTTTTAVDAALTYEGKSAYRLVSTMSDMTKDTTYVSKSGSQMYTYIALNPGAVAGVAGLDFGSRWMLIADFNASAWSILDTNLTDVPIDFNGTTLNAKINVKVSGAKGGTSSMTIGAATVQAQEFTMTFSINATVTVPFLGDQTIPVTFTQKTYVAENIGIVKTETLPFTISVPGTPPQSNNGSRETLKTYTVK